MLRIIGYYNKSWIVLAATYNNNSCEKVIKIKAFKGNSALDFKVKMAIWDLCLNELLGKQFIKHKAASSSIWPAVKSDKFSRSNVNNQILLF